MIESERPDGILLTFGGQTGLNCGVQLQNSGILEKYNVKVLGTPVRSIEITEDRKIFADQMFEIGEQVAPSAAAYTVEEVGCLCGRLIFVCFARAIHIYIHQMGIHSVQYTKDALQIGGYCFNSHNYVGRSPMTQL